MDSDEVLADPHMIERGFVTQVEHQETGSRPMGTVSWAIDGERPSNFRPAPLLGEHNQYVFCNLLGLSEEEVNGLVESGVIE